MLKSCTWIKAFIVISCYIMMAYASTVVAGEAPYITTAELKQKMDAGESLTLVNALSPIEHKELCIKGSVNIPASKVKAGHPLLPADKSSLLIFYCKGPKCGKSRAAATKAQKLGYTNVMVYNEGLPAWAKKGYPLERQVKYPKVNVPKLKPQEVQAQLDSIVLLDIRGKKHMAMGKIGNTVNILLDDMEEQYLSLPKDKKIVIMDHAGKQTLITAKFLNTKGYNNIAVMDGGMTAWMRAGLPSTK